MTTEQGCLWVVATPIGNLEDITFRALRVLKEADTILAEDTRRTRILCSHFEIETKVRPYHEHSPPRVTVAILRELKGGANFALVSDAGTPLINDPGQALVSEAIANGTKVIAVPGPTAVATALVASGFRSVPFTFYGFLPRSGQTRTSIIGEIISNQHVCVFFESPKRTVTTLKELALHCPDRKAAICREMTKNFEETIRGSLQELAEQLADPLRGEVTVVLAPFIPVRDTDLQSEEWSERIRKSLRESISVRDIAKMVSEETGLSKKQCYARALELNKELKTSL